MIYCRNCGNSNPFDSSFCEYCGISIDALKRKGERDSIYKKDEIPFLFRSVIYLHYWLIAFLGIYLIPLALGHQLPNGTNQTNFFTGFEIYNLLTNGMAYVLFVIPADIRIVDIFIVIIFLGLMIGFINKVKRYNEIGRILLILLMIINLGLSILTTNIMSIFISIFIIYVLAFHKKTRQLFNKSNVKNENSAVNTF